MTTVMKKAILVKTNGEVLIKESSWNSYEVQQVIGGVFDAVYFGDQEYSAYIHDEGKLIGLPENKIATEIWYDSGERILLGDYLAGDVLFIGPTDSEGNDTSVPLDFYETIIKYKERLGL